MRLSELLKATREHGRIDDYPSDPEITGLCHDSRRIKPGQLFAALPGLQVHGLRFQDQAQRGGAAAILTDVATEAPIPVILVPDARRALALLSNHFYGQPSRKLKLVGVTGTNGKTTVTFLVRSIFQAAGETCGLIGTIEYSGEQFSHTSSMTTPESVDFQELLLAFLKEGSSACSAEVSSQGLDQNRVTGCAFEAGIFTNLTQDHLDYHGSFEQYYLAKRRLFDPQFCDTRLAVINADDSYGRRLLEFRAEKRLRSVTYGFEGEADYRVTEWQSTMRGTDFVLRHNGSDHPVHTSLIGRYNVYNAIAACACMSELGFTHEAVTEGIRQMPCVPGRMEPVELGQPFNIFIDYAHTDDAFRQLLSTLRLYTAGRIIHIFGCRGERDKTKRPLMGQAAGQLADAIILTSDNPVNEDPADIAAQIKTGIDAAGNSNVFLVIDRCEAIAAAVKMARPGDTVVITGKGNETYQLIGGSKLPFDERECFRLALAAARPFEQQ